jgi:hypothetical protein
MLNSAGELESTIHRSFLKIARLKSWLTRPSCPPSIKTCKALFDKTFSVESHSDENHPPPSSDRWTQLPEEVRALLGDSVVTIHTRYRHNRHIYSRSSTHLGNSLITFYQDGNKNSPLIPSQIEYIITQGTTTFFIVKQHLQLHGMLDPFRHYPHLPIKLYSAMLSDHFDIVEVGWVHGHFARYPFSEDQVVVLSLSTHL